MRNSRFPCYIKSGSPEPAIAEIGLESSFPTTRVMLPSVLTFLTPSGVKTIYSNPSPKKSTILGKDLGRRISCFTVSTTALVFSSFMSILSSILYSHRSAKAVSALMNPKAIKKRTRIKFCDQFVSPPNDCTTDFISCSVKYYCTTTLTGRFITVIMSGQD